jgi:hypothetical protein
MKNVLAGLVAFALVAPAYAQPAPPHEVTLALHSVEACYMAQAKIVGKESCAPPPALVGAVLGACAPEEQSLISAIKGAYQADDELAAKELDLTRTKSTSAIQAVVLAWQSKARKCP